MDLKQLTRIRHGVRATLTLGVAASVAANVLHAEPNPISRAIAAWSPLALLLTIELISRVPVQRRGLSACRLIATAVIAGIAAFVSYWHMAAVAARYGETGASPYLLPLSVDGLVVVASICLVELGGRIRAAEEPAGTPSTAPSTARMVFDYAHPIGPERGVNLTPSKPAPKAPRKPPPSSAPKVIRAHQRTPDATNAELARRLKLSEETVKRHRPPRPVEKVNGRVPDLEEARSN